MDRKKCSASLAMRWEHSQALRRAAQAADAVRALTALLEHDPERPEAWQSLAELYQERGLERAAHDCLANARLLSRGACQFGGCASRPSNSPSSGSGLRAQPATLPRFGKAESPLSGEESAAEPDLTRAYELLQQDQPEKALALAQSALAAGQGNRLSAALAARAAWRAGRLTLAELLCRSALYDWPTCVPLHLVLAACLTAQGHDELAVEHVRLARTFDPDGEVSARWEKTDDAEPSPVAVDVALDAVQLADPAPEQLPAPEPAADAIHVMREAFEQLVQQLDTPLPNPKSETRTELALSLPRAGSRGEAEGRSRRVKNQKSYRPFHAIVSAREGLARVCGSRASIVERAMADLALTVKRYEQVSAEALFVDDAASLVPFGLAPVRAVDAVCVKQLLDELDDALNQRGLQLASILIVGGDDVIPFCRLPNPADDPDADVPSDVPYGCCPESELLPQRLLGRMPHAGLESDQAASVNLLLLQLGAALRARVEQKQSAKGLADLLRRLPAAFGWGERKPAQPPPSSFGYAASIWRRAAQEVFSAIGPAQALRLSPPMDSADMGALLGQVCPQLAYFNLHGLPDSPNWYGQRDPEFIADYSTFPVALSPADVERPVKVVFTAACYGAHLSGRDTQSSIALRFMQAGTLALVGSTTVAYGGLSVPLVGVDLLGQLFWQHIVSGHSSGEALRQAKLGFAAQVQRRQGYLDGEDQKTLASFILLGDPLLAPLPLLTSLPARLELQSSRRKAMAAGEALVLGQGTCRHAGVDVPCDQLERVQAFVAHTLPEMADASVRLSHPAGTCRRTCSGESGKEAKRLVSSQANSPLQVSLSKTLPYDGRQGVQVVRVTVDGEGKILKLAVSK